MRFLIGIITGTALTLFIATAVDAPTKTTLEKIRVHMEKLWDGLIDSTSDSLFHVEAKEVDHQVIADHHPAPAESVSPLAEPAPALAPPAELPPLELPMVGATPADAATAPQAPAQQPSPEPEAGALAGLAARTERTLPTEIGEMPVASVWVPFHSQMSAEGFAARLSRELDHDFSVQRHGAGSYQVVFNATTSAEREQLLARIAEITGQ